VAIHSLEFTGAFDFALSNSSHCVSYCVIVKGMALPLIVNLILLLQPPSLIVQQQQDQKAAIEGLVVRIGTGEPIAGAEMKLIRMAASDATLGAVQSSGEAIGPPVLPTTASDGNGRFVFKDLDAGSYRITAARNGYVKLEYGQRISRGPGTVITVVKGQAIKDIVFHLTPTGNVSGNVRDVSGEPLTGFQVLLLRSAYNPMGRRSFQAIESARTDDRSAYRFYWVTPGRYYQARFSISNGRSWNLTKEGSPRPCTGDS
jgi:hypothetical protein